MVNKKWHFGSLALTLILLTSLADAGRLKLKDGSYFEVPDELAICNDLDEDIQLGEEKTNLSPREKTTIRVNASKKAPQVAVQLLTLFISGNKHYLKYPTYFHPQATNVHTRKKFTNFKYHASTVLNNTCNDQGLTTPRVIINK